MIPKLPDRVKQMYYTKCPVCNSELAIDFVLCKKCGYTVSFDYLLPKKRIKMNKPKMTHRIYGKWYKELWFKIQELYKKRP